MKFWTHHPSTFRLDDPSVRIDWMKGKFWKGAGRGFRYQEVLPLLQARLGTDQFLWACTVRGTYTRMSPSIDLEEWEIELPISDVLAFIRVPVWEDIVWGRSDDWSKLFVAVSDEQEAASPDIDALIRFPVKSQYLRCHGTVLMTYGKNGRRLKHPSR